MAARGDLPEGLQLGDGEIDRLLLGRVRFPEWHHRGPPILVEGVGIRGVEFLRERQAFRGEDSAGEESGGVVGLERGILLHFPEAAQGADGDTRGPGMGRGVVVFHPAGRVLSFGQGEFASGDAEFGAVAFLPRGLTGDAGHQLHHEEFPDRFLEVESLESAAFPERRLGRHVPAEGNDRFGRFDEVPAEAVFFLLAGEPGIVIAPETDEPRSGLVVGAHRIMGTPIGADAASHEPLHVADGVQEEEALHKSACFGCVLAGFRQTPAVHRGVEIETVEHRAILDRLEPPEGVRFAGAALLGGGQVHLALEIAEVDEDAVFIDEAPPELGMGLIDGGRAVGMEGFATDGETGKDACTERQRGLDERAAFHGAMGSISTGTRLRLSMK